MRSKTSNVKLILSLIITSILLFTLSVPAFARDGTDGTELQIATPEQLEIQLGTAWAGVEFQLKTDAGLYPGTIPVGDDGVLRLEISLPAWVRELPRPRRSLRPPLSRQQNPRSRRNLRWRFPLKLKKPHPKPKSSSAKWSRLTPDIPCEIFRFGSWGCSAAGWQWPSGC